MQPRMKTPHRGLAHRDIMKRAFLFQALLSMLATAVSYSTCYTYTRDTIQPSFFFLFSPSSSMPSFLSSFSEYLINIHMNERHKVTSTIVLPSWVFHVFLSFFLFSELEPTWLSWEPQQTLNNREVFSASFSHIYNIYRALYVFTPLPCHWKYAEKVYRSLQSLFFSSYTFHTIFFFLLLTENRASFSRIYNKMRNEFSFLLWVACHIQLIHMQLLFYMFFIKSMPLYFSFSFFIYTRHGAGVFLSHLFFWHYIVFSTYTAKSET